MKGDYYKEFEKRLAEAESFYSENGYRKKLLLHSCCAPCSTACIDACKDVFDLTVFYYNPNITDEAEYKKRLAEQKEYCEKLNIKVIEGEYNPKDFFTSVKGFENVSEGGERCFICYRLRLNATKKVADENSFDYFCSTLSLSPYKNADKLNEIGLSLEQRGENGVIGARYLVNDFKKKNGYFKSIELSKRYGLYRQNYCGCVFSKLEVERSRALKR